MPANLLTFISSCDVLGTCEKNAYNLGYRSTMFPLGGAQHNVRMDLRAVVVVLHAVGAAKRPSRLLVEE